MIEEFKTPHYFHCVDLLHSKQLIQSYICLLLMLVDTPVERLSVVPVGLGLELPLVDKPVERLSVVPVGLGLKPLLYKPVEGQFVVRVGSDSESLFVTESTGLEVSEFLL